MFTATLSNRASLLLQHEIAERLCKQEGAILRRTATTAKPPHTALAPPLLHICPYKTTRTRTSPHFLSRLRGSKRESEIHAEHGFAVPIRHVVLDSEVATDPEVKGQLERGLNISHYPRARLWIFWRAHRLLGRSERDAHVEQTHFSGARHRDFFDLAGLESDDRRDAILKRPAAPQQISR